MNIPGSGLPYRLDLQAFEVGYFVVLDFNYKTVRVCDTVDEAEEFIAAANGTDTDTVRRESEERAQMMGDYLANLKRGRRRSESDPSVAPD